MSERGELLRVYVDAVKGKPIEWSVDDCSPWAAQWAANITGKEFDWPAYSSREEAIEVTARGGGLVRMWERTAAIAGLRERIADPVLGDVGIIDTSFGPVGGIFATGRTFCWRAERGVRVLAVRRHLILKVFEV